MANLCLDIAGRSTLVVADSSSKEVSIQRLEKSDSVQNPAVNPVRPIYRVRLVSARILPDPGSQYHRT